MTTIEDEHTLRNMITADYPQLPYTMYGHSWGSMIARGYTAIYGERICGAVYCGVVSGMNGMDALYADLDAAIKAGQGTASGMDFMGRMFAGMTDRYENPNGPNDWIALDADVVTDHGQDPFNNLTNPPTVQLMYDFASLYNFIEADDWAGKVPVALPIYIISGDQDPVGNYGEGVYHVSNMLWNSGHKNVKTKIYSGYRHEIHNEPPIREEVEDGIIAFVQSIL